jgi:hypothetical protein
MTWRPRVEGYISPEHRGETIARMAEAYVGCSLSERTAELAELVAGGDDDPAQAVRVRTNCATFARGIMEACGVYHDALDRPYELGAAVADVLDIARSRRALAPNVTRWATLPRGSLLHYGVAGRNVDHIEFLLGDATLENGFVAPTCGGGRPNNAITRMDPHDVRRTPSGNPLAHVVHPVPLLAQTVELGIDVAGAYQDVHLIDYECARERHSIRWTKVKFCEGVSREPDAVEHAVKAYRAGLLVGGYLRFIPWRPPQSQVDAFASVVTQCNKEGIQLQLCPDLDVETWGQKLASPLERARRLVSPSWVLALEECLRLLEVRFGAALRYHNAADWIRMGQPASLLRWPLWLGDYTGTPDLEEWIIWQRKPKLFQGVYPSPIDWSVARNLPWMVP